MRNRKILSLLLTVALLLGCAACGGGQGGGEQSFTVADGTQRYRAEEAEQEPLPAAEYACSLEDVQTDGLAISLAESSDGRLYVLESRAEGALWIGQVDPESGSVSGRMRFPERIDTIYDGDGQYDLYATDGQTVYGLTLESLQAARLFSATALGLPGVVELAAEDGQFFLYTGAESAARVLPDDGSAPEKTVLTLATVLESREMVEMVAAFNASQDAYSIEIVAYGQEGLPRLQAELMAGDLPDILNVGNYDLPVDSLIRLGYLEDLYPYLDADPELSRESLLPNVRAAFEHDGALYEAFSSFRMFTAVSGPASVEDDLSVLLAQWLEAGGQMPSLLDGYGHGGFNCRELMQSVCDALVDWEAGTCAFDSEAFQNLLRYAAAMPETMEYNPAETILDGTAQWYMSFAGTPQRISLFHAVWGDNFRLDGLAGMDGTSNNYISRDKTMLAISSTSEHKDICWTFIRTLWDPDYQIDPYDPIDRHMNSPTNTEAFAAAMEGYRTMESDITTMGAIGQQNYEYPEKPAESDIQMFEELVEATDRTLYMDDALLDIIYEESNRLFAGEQSVEEAAANIQSRASIYVAEQS